MTYASTVALYGGPGSSKESVHHTICMLRDLGCDPLLLDAPGLIRGQWKQQATAVIMPGGRDVPYAHLLTGAGNAQLTDFVNQGGVYIGICAGAYYGARRLTFQLRSGQMLSQERELGFFPGTAAGPHLAAYDTTNRSGARAAPISLKWPNQEHLTLYYHGGCAFFPDAPSCAPVSTENSHILQELHPWATYADGAWAMVCHTFGRGTVFLSGVHFEYDPQELQNWQDQKEPAQRDPYLPNLMPALWTTDGARRRWIRSLFAFLFRRPF